MKINTVYLRPVQPTPTRKEPPYKPWKHSEGLAKQTRDLKRTKHTEPTYRTRVRVIYESRKRTTAIKTRTQAKMKPSEKGIQNKESKSLPEKLKDSSTIKKISDGYNDRTIKR